MKKFFTWVFVGFGSIVTLYSFAFNSTFVFILSFIFTFIFVWLATNKEEIVLSTTELHNLRYLQNTSPNGDTHFGLFCPNTFFHKDVVPKMLPQKEGWECRECSYRMKYTDFEKELANWGVVQVKKEEKKENA